MPPVYLVKTPPLLRRERSQDRMHQHARFRPEPLFRIVQRGIHGNQRVVKLPQRLAPKRGSRCGLPGCFHTGRESPDAQDVKGANAMTEGPIDSLDLTGRQRAQQALGRGGVRQQEVFEDLQRIPFAIRSAGQRIRQHPARGAFGFASDEFEFWRHPGSTPRGHSNCPRSSDDTI
jgi:hypothetical protein